MGWGREGLGGRAVSVRLRIKVFRTIGGDGIGRGRLNITNATISTRTYNLLSEGNGGVLPGVPAVARPAGCWRSGRIRQGWVVEGASDGPVRSHQCALEDQHHLGEFAPCMPLIGRCARSAT